MPREMPGDNGNPWCGSGPRLRHGQLLREAFLLFAAAAVCLHQPARNAGLGLMGAASPGSPIPGEGSGGQSTGRDTLLLLLKPQPQPGFSVSFLLLCVAQPSTHHSSQHGSPGHLWVPSHAGWSPSLQTLCPGLSTAASDQPVSCWPSATG